MTRNIITIIVGLILMSNHSFAQVLDAHYSFTSCSFSDLTSTYTDATPVGSSPSCVCGVVDDGLVFNGSESLEFSDLDMAFDGDYSMSFYIFPDINATGLMDILSISGDTCSVDSTLSITYSPIQNKIKLDIRERASKRIHLEGTLDPNKCWHHIVITNTDNHYNLYVDEIRTDVATSSTRLLLKPSARFRISGNPCNTASSTLDYKGLFDELLVWDYALSQEEINQTYKYADKIISQDKTIFLGESFQVNTGQICSNSFSWTPNDEFETTGERAPKITPTHSEKYVLSINSNGCSISDTLNLFVVDPQDLDCNNILLPRAFTPNNDGLNETYGISNDFIITDLHSFDIYDRWSNKVFHSNDVNSKWDGSFNGEKLNPGLYVYKISYTCKSKTYNKTSSFSLLR